VDDAVRRVSTCARVSASLVGGRIEAEIRRVTTDPYAELRDRVLASVLDGPGESDPALRRAAAQCTDLPADLRTLVDTIHQHAYRVTDEDIARAREVYGDERLFEIVVSAALGASRRRLLAGLEALDLA
jgi:hypothetical protein